MFAANAFKIGRGRASNADIESSGSGNLLTKPGNLPILISLDLTSYQKGLRETD